MQFLCQYDIVASALATHVADVAETEQQLELAAGALARHLMSDAVEQDALRAELMEGIRAADPVRMRCAVNRGEVELVPGALHGSSKGPKESLVNPVEWAVLEGFYKEAIFLLELTDGHVAFNRDEECSTLQVVRMAERCQQAVVVACVRGQVKLLRELLQRGADCAQREKLTGCTALHVAARSGEEEAAALLLERGAWSLENRKEEVLKHAEAHRLQCIIDAAGLAAQQENALDPKLPEFHEVIQVLSSAKEEDRALTWAEIEERSVLAARARPTTLPGYVPESAEGVPWGPLHTVAEARRAQKELLGQLSKAIRKSDVIGVQVLVQRGAPMEVNFDLGYGEHGNCVDLAVACEKPGMALTLLEIADAKQVGEALAQNSIPAFFWSVLRGYCDVLEGAV
ncbi:unnamed protein product [Durusdinium trenchii]|uniref:Uncharacterized protein n=1 Tax=Durusdinium trenchii TaxID=1381693 RepID=A0ABP0SXD4_9DINO